MNNQTASKEWPIQSPMALSGDYYNVGATTGNVAITSVADAHTKAQAALA